VSPLIPSAPAPVPKDGIVFPEVATTDSDGYAHFQFNISAKIPRERPAVTCYDDDNVTSIPIDGMVYFFIYCFANESRDPCSPPHGPPTQAFVFLAFSDVVIPNDPTWVDHVGPILTQFARVTKIMDAVLNMSNYTAVTQPHNINLMNLSLRLDFEDPSYMPTTCDLSTAKKNMILEWLENPLYDSAGSTPDIEDPVCEPPNDLLIPKSRTVTPRCEAEALLFADPPQVLDKYYEKIFQPDTRKGRGYIEIKGHPLFGRRGGEDADWICTRHQLAIQLQTAIALEWATIPPYLTAMYSIVEGCNTEIYSMIRTIVIQEMLHFLQAANILIAMGGTPVIDSADFAPSYPTRLPGCVLPGLLVTLEKLSLEYVQRVFMGIEVPQKTEVAGDIDTDKYTIGAFYEEISDCINILGDDIFDLDNVDNQVNWPWDPTNQVGEVHPITDAASAIHSIKNITAQGEGEGLMDPSDIGNYTLAHFFKFEEIVCEQHLVQVSEDTYAYRGDIIAFRSDGVWPMRNKPKASDVPPDTNCYTESQVFHLTYRALLRKLQEVFDGNPDKINEAITIMESLQVHAKKLMWTKFYPDSDTDDTTCGPVWDYSWNNPLRSLKK
jgi:hypothetical protein